MTVRQLYNELCNHYPTFLSCEWDNDGLMCCSDDGREVRRILLTLDVTDAAIDHAEKHGFDLIISHHPLIFRPIGSVEPSIHISRRIIKLIKAEISVMSFHTRADAAISGVNDVLAEALGLENCKTFGPAKEEMGRVGELPSYMMLADFCEHVKKALGSPIVLAAGDRPVKRVAVLGGDGKDFVSFATAVGADTYISGRIGYNIMENAGSYGINLVEAGHYFTEAPVLSVFAETVKDYIPDVYTEIFNSNEIKIY